MTLDDGLEPEEAWEHDVAAALGRLPTVEPPAGFIDRAVDHRPRHAGRVIASLLALSVGSMGLSLAVSGNPPSTQVAEADTSTTADGSVADELRTAVGGRDLSLLDDAADGVLALARQLGFP